MPIIRKRLQIQATGQSTIDRSLIFVIGELTESERKKLRGTFFYVNSKVEALKYYKKIHKLAKEAVANGEIQQFLDSLNQNGGQRKASSPSFLAFSKEWYEVCIQNSSLTESQKLADRSSLRCHLKPFFGQYLLEEINPRHVDRFIATMRAKNHRGKPYKGKTINNQLSVLHRIMDKAIDYCILEKNPVTKSAWQKRECTPEDMKNWWTPEEEEKAMAVLNGWGIDKQGERLTIITQLFTAIRFSELRALDKSDVDFTIPGILIRRSMVKRKIGPTKNKHARFQVIPKGLAEQLKRYMLTTSNQILFPGVHGGRLSNNTLNRWYRELCTKAEIPIITSHGARHTSGASYSYMGLSQKSIAGLLGHRDTKATERYVHIRSDWATPYIEDRWTRLSGGGA